MFHFNALGHLVESGPVVAASAGISIISMLAGWGFVCISSVKRSLLRRTWIASTIPLLGIGASMSGLIASTLPLRGAIAEKWYEDAHLEWHSDLQLIFTIIGVATWTAAV